VAAMAATLGIVIGIGGLGAAQATAPVTEPSGSEASAGAGTDPPGSESAPSAPADSAWQTIVPGGDCECADGSEFSFFVREADPTKVVFFLEGGGACFSAETCAFTDAESTTYNWHIGSSNHPDEAGGIFDLDDPDNPFADYSMVFVPYCTGDVHIGDATTEYDADLTVEHKGAVNGAAAVSYLGDHFPDAEEVVVIGGSAGAVASPLCGGLVSDALPDADVTVFADGSGGYPDVPALNSLLGGLWGTMNAVPDWPENEGMTAEEWSFPGLWVQAGTHDPDITMSRFDYAYDEVQVFFAGLAGVAGDDLLAFMLENEASIEAAGVDQLSFTAPGDDHTLVRRDEFYTMEVGGTSLIDWLTGVVDDPDDAVDVQCTDCEPPSPDTTTGDTVSASTDGAPASTG
jgi:hypothetical protein